MSLVRETRKITVETLSKQLEYVIRLHSNMYNIVLNLKQLHSLVPFSSLLLLTVFLITLWY